MCLCTFFFDKEWKLHTVINFCRASSYKCKEIGKMVESCFINWEIEKLSTITVDNASLNDVVVNYFRNMVSK